MEASRWWCHPGSLAGPHSAVASAVEAPAPPVLVSRAPGGCRRDRGRAAAPYVEWPAAPSAATAAAARALAVTARPRHVGRSRPPPTAAVAAAAAADTPALVPDAAGDLPDGFEFPAAHRPRLPHDAFDDLAVPVFDLAALSAAAAAAGPLDGDAGTDSSSSSSPLAALRRACEELGLFQLVNHGFPTPLAARLRRVGRGFFRRPHAAKQALATGRRFLGYTSGVPNASGGRMWRESFGVRLVLGRQTSGASPPSPSPLATRLAAAAAGADDDDDAAVVAEYALAMEAVARRVLECMARSLGLPAPTLAQHFQGDRTALVSMNHYPPCPAPDRALGFFVHTDPFALTVVHQDDDSGDGAGAGDMPPLGGLQVQDAGGEWRGVRPLPGALVVNLGDLVQAWTNDRFVSAQHRVAAPPPGDRSRLSLCFFYSPARDAVVEAPQALVEAAAGRRYYRRFGAIEFAREVDAVGAGGRGHVLRRFRVDSAGDQDD